MKFCKSCHAVISLDLADLLKGECPAPKKVTTPSVIANLCAECYEKLPTDPIPVKTK